MARPPRYNVDYFPFLCEEGKKMFYIEETYGNDGFATFIKILRELAKTDNHFLDLSKNTTVMFLSAKCKVSKETLLSIVNDLVDLEKFDKMLWAENNVIWCQDFIDGIQDAYSKRKNKCITYDGLLLLLISLGVRKPSNQPPKEPVKPQSKVEETIVEDIKEKNSIIKQKTLLSEINISDLEGLDLEYFQIAKAYQGLFIKNLKEKNAPTKNQENAKYKNYVDPIRLMMTTDGVTREQITKVFQFLGSPSGEFWKSNILSTKKLREKFEQLIIKSQSQTTNSPQSNKKRSAAEIIQEKYNIKTN